MSRPFRRILLAVALSAAAGSPGRAASEFFAETSRPTTNLISTLPANRWGLFRETDEIVVNTAGHTSITVMNWRGTVVYDGAPGPMPRLPVGHYFIETRRDRNQFAVLPADYHGASFLGTEADQATDPAQTMRVDSVDPKIVRMMGGGLHWPEVRPAAGVWSWEKADRAVELNFSKGRKIMVMAFVRPDWLLHDADFTTEYLAYVEAVAHRYGNKLYGIEIWNEPWTTFGLWGRLPNPDEPDQPIKDWHRMMYSYVEILRQARKVIKPVNSNINVIGPAFENANSYYDVAGYFAKLGGSSLLDAFSYHDYNAGLYPPDSHPRYKFSYLKRPGEEIRSFQTALGTTKLPVLLDEIGLYGHSALGIPNTGDTTYNPDVSWQVGMWRAVKLAVMYRAAGVQALIPHVFPLGTSDPRNNMELYGWEFGERGPHPKTSAFLMACYWLDGAGPIQQRVIGDRVFLYGWSRPDGCVLVMAWCTEANSVKLRPAETYKTTDIFGQANQTTSLGPEPVLFNATPPTSTQDAMDAVAAMIQPTK